MVESVLNSVVNSEACARTGPQADAAEAQALVDQFGRVHTSLRISVTDRCPLRCVYCLPPQGVTWLPTTSILSAAEIERIAAVCAAAGVTVFRLTGGEPLMRGDIVEIVARLARLRTPAGDPVEVTMTTSGIGLEALHDDLVAAGLDRINISLDTLRPQRFLELTRRDRLDEVLRGIGVAARGPLHPPKLNAVVMRGINDDELIDLTEFAIDLGAQMRFIEQMPLDAGRTWQRDRMVTCQEILGTLAGHWKLTPMPGRDHAPAESFLLDGGPATVGVIAAVTTPFCDECDRLRLTADGWLRNCLFTMDEFDLASPLRSPRTDEATVDQAIDAVLRACVEAKDSGHQINEPWFDQPARGMNAIGG